MPLLIVCIVLFVLYAFLIIYLWLGWKSASEFDIPPQSPSVKISVVIAARNEEKNIGALLTQLALQTYPAGYFEVIVVDDHSDDQTTTVVQQFPGVRLVELRTGAINSYKKKAIEAGIAAASGELIVTTDADCVPTPEWLETIASFYTAKKASFMAAPVVFICNSSVLQVFQAMDFMVLQGITGAAVNKKMMNMCNGANMAYERTAFYDVNGFTGIDHIASGDDMLLMHKIAKQNPDRVHYLKSKKALVATSPVLTWKEFFNQRIRWASKAKNYDDKRITAVLLLVYLFNLSFLVLAVAGFFSYHYWLWLAALIVAKTITEFPFFLSLAAFFEKKWAIRLFPLFQPLHIIYTVIAGLFGQFGKYGWKGRQVR